MVTLPDLLPCFFLHHPSQSSLLPFVYVALGAGGRERVIRRLYIYNSSLLLMLARSAAAVIRVMIPAATIWFVVFILVRESDVADGFLFMPPEEL
jgi:hypothetical protein